MVSLLSRWFVKNRDDVKNPAVRRAYGTMVAIVCVVLNVLLFTFKFLVGTLTHSISIRADAVNNLSDAGSSIISLVSFKISSKPADRRHPFGHARIEYIASMIVSFLILFVGVELIRNSVEKLIAPVATLFSAASIAVLAVSVAVKLWMAYCNRAVGRRIGSEVMRATAVDSLSDAGATAAVLLSVVLARFLPEKAAVYVDPVMGILVAAMILFAGLRVLNDTKNSLLGEAPDKETVETIRAVVAEYPDALGIHDLAVHNYGPGRTLASLHVEVDGKRDIFASHDTIDLIERRLKHDYGIEATIHLDPVTVDDPVSAEWKERVAKIAAGIDPRIRIHDFRMVPGVTHTNLIFDTEIPFELKQKNEEVAREIAEKIAAEAPDFFAVITVDRA